MPIAPITSYQELLEALEDFPRDLPPMPPEKINHQCTCSSRLCGAKLSMQFSVDQRKRVVCYTYQTEMSLLGLSACFLLFQKIPGALCSDLYDISHSTHDWLMQKRDDLPSDLQASFHWLSSLREHCEKREQVLIVFECIMKAFNGNRS